MRKGVSHNAQNAVYNFTTGRQTSSNNYNFKLIGDMKLTLLNNIPKAYYHPFPHINFPSGTNSFSAVPFCTTTRNCN